MNNCCIAALRGKEVVNICDGERLGCVCDVEIDLGCGKVCALLLPQDGRLFSLSGPPMLRISWDCVERVGEDIVLVRVNPGELRPCPPPKRRFF